LNPAQLILILLVRSYRWVLSPAKLALFGPAARCRFTPSCSAYALQALQQHGAIRGSLLSVQRICRCHPWGATGHDPVPAPQPVRSLLPLASVPHPSSPHSLTLRKETGGNVSTAA
jgi:uncharacterized protein